MLTVCAKAQLITSTISKNPFDDTTFVRKFSILCNEHKEFKIKIAEQDSINQGIEAELVKCDLQYESCRVSMDILEIDNRNKMDQLVKSIKQAEELKNKNDKLIKNIAFQKKLKWWTLGTGLIGGALTTICFTK